MQAWPNYKACASYDRKYWFRIKDTTYDKEKGVLLWHHKPERVGSTGHRISRACCRLQPGSA